MKTFMIDKDKIKEIIGKGGAVIKSMQRNFIQIRLQQIAVAYFHRMINSMTTNKHRIIVIFTNFFLMLEFLCLKFFFIELFHIQSTPIRLERAME
mgnify:CR=1 FL=1